MTGQPIVFVVKRYSDILGVFTSEAAACEYADRAKDAETLYHKLDMAFEVIPAPFVVSPGPYSDAYEPVKAGE